MALLGYMEVFLAVICLIFILGYCRSSNGLPKNWPIVGMFPYVITHLRHLHDWSTELLKKSNNTFLFIGLWISGFQLILTADLENVNYILNTNFANFPKGVEFRDMFDVFGDALINADFELWKTNRKIAQMIITHQLFKKFFVRSTMEKVEKGLLPVFDHFADSGAVVDFQEIVQRLLFDSNCLTVTGFDPGSLAIDFPHNAFLKSLDIAEETIFYRHAIPKKVWKFLRWLNVGHERKFKQAWKTFDLIMPLVIAMKKREVAEANRNGNAEVGGSLLESYLRDYKHEDQFLRDTMLGYMLAGRDTVSSVLIWFMWLITRHKEAEAKVLNEIDSLLSPDERGRRRLFTGDDVKEMTYLQCALSETLRLYPPVPFELKVPLKPDTLPSGHRVNPKQKIIIPLYSVARLPSIWGDDCLEFKPERWFSERGGLKHEPPHKFLAFHAGPRSCLGKEVSYTQLKIVAATLLHNYCFQVLEGQHPTPKAAIILLMKNGLKVKVTHRRAS